MFENDTRFTGSTSPSFARNNAIRVHGYSSLSLFIFLTLRRRLKMSSRIIDKERGCVISVEGRCKQRCFSLRDPRSWRKIVNERVGSGSWPSKWQAENDALALRLRIQSGSWFRSPTANNYVIEASRVLRVDFSHWERRTRSFARKWRILHPCIRSLCYRRATIFGGTHSRLNSSRMMQP